MRKILVKGGCVLTMDPRRGNHPRADVLVEEGLIAEIGPNLRSRDAEVIDADGSIVMPGFVDAHRHVWESLFRGLGDLDDGPDAASLLGTHFSPDDVYAATLIGLLGAVEAGVTTVVDWSDLAHGDHARAALQAHADSGVRTVLVSTAAPDGFVAGSASVGGPLVTAAMGLDRAEESDGEAWQAARSAGLRIHAHAGVDPGSAGTVARLGAAGVLGPDVNLVHCSKLGADDFAAIVASGATITSTPAGEMARGLGAPPIQALIDRGLRPGLGVDTERVVPGDLFAQMRSVISIQHATLFDLKLAGKAGIPNLLTTREVIRYATVDGARAAGLDGVGTLEPGKQADLIVLRTDLPNIFPINDPIGAVVWGMDTSNLDWVLVAGRPLMRGGVLDADRARARDLALQARERVASAAGLLAGTASGGPG